MRIILDERETSLYDKCISIYQKNAIKNDNIKIIKRVIPLGDVLIETDDETLFLLVERKSLQDLLSSIKDGRYEEQSYRLQNSNEFLPNRVFYLIEGMFSQLSKPEHQKIIQSSMTSLSIFKGFNVIRTCSVQESAEWLVNMVHKIDRNLKKGISPFCYKLIDNKNTNINNNEIPLDSEQNLVSDPSTIPLLIPSTTTPVVPSITPPIVPYCSVVKKVKKENITPENMGEIILCQIPGISSISAVAIMKSVDGSFLKLIDILQKDPRELEKVHIQSENEKPSRKISKTILQNLQKYLIR
jgi:ERCC4-type nuclease